MDEHCRGCVRYLTSCSGLSKELCEKHKLRIPITNADRFRAKTDEELAEWFAEHDAGLIANVLNNDYVEPTKDSWLEWLKEECET